MSFVPRSGRIAFRKAALQNCSRANAGSNNAAQRSILGRRWNSQDARASDSAEKAATKTLAQVLADSIRASGPLSVSTFMRTCLLDPQQGYYAASNTASTSLREQEERPSAWTATGDDRDVLGARGDFITSPEISQVFGELAAIFFVARWQTVNPSGAIRLVELGPGKGTLLADMIRTFARFRAFFQQLKAIHLVETSPGLMGLQHDALESALSKVGKKIVAADKEVLEEDEVRLEWFPLAETVPLQPDMWSMVVAHEFFDALPTHIFEKTSQGFREVLVDVDREKVGQSGVTVLKASDIAASAREQEKEQASVPTKEAKFRYVLSPTPTPWSMLLAARNPRFDVLQPGQRVEVSPESWATARRVGELVSGRKARETVADPSEGPEETAENQRKRQEREEERQRTSTQGGAGLIIDYGDEKAFGASFRAFKSHQIVDPLDAPGTADLTCNVDFTYLKNGLATTDARPLGPMFQSHFLQALGLRQRVDALVANASDDQRKAEIEQGAHRLTDPMGMGAQYKVLGVCADAEAAQGGEAEQGATQGAKCYPFEM